MSDQELLTSAELRELLEVVGYPWALSYSQDSIWQVLNLYEELAVEGHLGHAMIYPKQAAALIFNHLFDWLVEKGRIPHLWADVGDHKERIWRCEIMDMQTDTEVIYYAATKLQAVMKACQAVVKELK